MRRFRTQGRSPLVDRQESERWLPVPGYEGLYEVSDLGRVRSLRSGQLRSLCSTPKNPYPRLVLTGRGQRVTKLVHRLVLIAFVGDPLPGTEVCHGNGDPADNRLKNLRWGTSAENQADRLRHGTLPRGENIHTAKLSAADVVAIRAALRKRESQRKIAARFGVSQRSIGRINLGLSWRGS